jgi:hypothetical protein
MNLTNLTPEQTLEVLGLVHYAENNTETQKEHYYKKLYPTLLSKFEWIDELQLQYEDAIESKEDYTHGLSFDEYVLSVELNRQINAKDMNAENE